MYLSKNDIYPGSSNTLPTVENTVPDDIQDVSAPSNNTTTHPNSTQKVTVDKNMIWGALLMLIGLMFALHFLGGE